MSKQCTEKYSQQLGINIGTASARLLKMLLFKFGAEGTECYKCGQLIESVDTMSIDHVIPWRNEDNAQELFWDLDNVTFTHKACNKADRTTRIVGPDGTSWCGRHKEFLPISEFGVDADRWNGLNSVCLACDCKRMAEYAARNPRFPCPECGYQMRKVCQGCGYALPMAEYMALRRLEGVAY